MLKAGALVLLLIASIKFLPKLNFIAPCGCDFIMFHPLAMWHCGQNRLEIEPCAHFCGCGNETELDCAMFTLASIT